MSKNSSRKLFVGYFRVSTDRQGRSGLGLEAQMDSVRRYVNGHGELVSEYTEVESGKRLDRPELTKALNHSRRIGATLVIAKLDRLSRSVKFTAALLESGQNFLACDMPEANKLTIHILAAVAENEARLISQRTKDALAAYKARGGKLGSHNPKCREVSLEAARRGSPLGGMVMREKAKAETADVTPRMLELRSQGKSLREIADDLNESEFVTRQGSRWQPVQIKRVLDRVSG